MPLAFGRLVSGGKAAQVQMRIVRREAVRIAYLAMKSSVQPHLQNVIRRETAD
jgi:hypothetical protein